MCDTLDSKVLRSESSLLFHCFIHFLCCPLLYSESTSGFDPIFALQFLTTGFKYIQNIYVSKFRFWPGFAFWPGESHSQMTLWPLASLSFLGSGNFMLAIIKSGVILMFPLHN